MSLHYDDDVASGIGLMAKCLELPLKTQFLDCYKPVIILSFFHALQMVWNHQLHSWSCINAVIPLLYENPVVGALNKHTRRFSSSLTRWKWGIDDILWNCQLLVGNVHNRRHPLRGQHGHFEFKADRRSKRCQVRTSNLVDGGPPRTGLRRVRCQNYIHWKAKTVKVGKESEAMRSVKTFPLFQELTRHPLSLAHLQSGTQNCHQHHQDHNWPPHATVPSAISRKLSLVQDLRAWSVASKTERLCSSSYLQVQSYWGPIRPSNVRPEDYDKHALEELL